MHPLELRVVAVPVVGGLGPKASGHRGIGVYVVVCLIPVSALCLPASLQGTSEAGSSRPYLAVIGPPSLRFKEAIVPQPDLGTRPAAGGPPRPATEHSEAAPAADRPGSRAQSADSRLGTPTAPAAPQSQPKAGSPEDSAPAGAPILPDDSRPKVRPEDFLPYFQFPGAGANPEDVASPPVPMKPGQQPPSTATYRQQ